MAENLTEWSRLKQKSIIKFLVVEKSKPWEIYRRMCDVYQEAWFSRREEKEKMFTNVLNCLKKVKIVFKIKQANESY